MDPARAQRDQSGPVLARHGSMTRTSVWRSSAALALTLSCCAPAVHPTASPATATRQMTELWRPTDTRAADLFNGPWGPEYAPDSNAVYVFVKPKTHGVN